MNARHTAAPGLAMQSLKLNVPVVSCVEAAAARGVPLEYELKTLILDSSAGVFAVHIPGDSKLVLRSVKRHLRVSQAFLASPETLAHYGLEPGTICPILEPVWEFKHLISRRVLNLEYVTSNDGTLTGYFRFDPKCLLEANKVMIGDFASRGTENEVLR